MRKKKDDKIAALQLPLLGLQNVPFGGIIGDPMGSYTGRQLMEDILDERDAIPVQDADDL